MCRFPERRHVTFERVSQVGETLATGMSRRGFLGSLGRWAGATALAMAGVLTTTGFARAGGRRWCCECGSRRDCIDDSSLCSIMCSRYQVPNCGYCRNH
jgi:hypothetical protein